MTRRRRALLVAVLVAVSLIATVIAVQRSAGTGSQTSADPGYGELSRPPGLLVISDSFGGGVDPRIPIYWALIARRAGWVARSDSVGGSGYANTDQPTVIERLPADREQFDPDIILVDVGRNDLSLDPAIVVPRIGEYLRELRRTYPDAEIVVIVPGYVSTYVPPTLDALRTAIVRSAETIDAAVVDPVADGWWRNRDLEPLLWQDGVHLEAAGNAYFADRLYAELVRLGIAPDRGAVS